VPDGIFSRAYEALGRGDAGPLLDLLGPDFEWEEPSLPGYPLGGVHRGAEGFTTGVLAPLAELLEGLTFSVGEVVAAGDREVVCGVMHGMPAGSDEEWELPFAHVWELDAEGAPARATAYFDRSRLTLASSRRQLADVADELLDQAAEIRQQWSRLGDALRAAGVEGPDDALEGSVEDGGASSSSPSSSSDAGVGPGGRVGSARLMAVDMASEGSTREEVEAYLREELEVEDPEPILAEVFDGAGGFADGGGSGSGAPGVRPGALDPSRLTRLFARNRG
jgi:ketosteroid isomerase-like protein